MDRAPTLVLLAAGIGRRFGGLKQLAPVGPRGEALLDYSIRDAAAAGFERVVLIVRHAIEPEIVAHFETHAALPYSLAYQDDVPPPRDKPWGTTHAMLSLRGAVDGPFAVANADDYYGADAMRVLGEWLRSPDCAPGHAVLVGYPIDATLPDDGAVTRGICEVDDDGRLVRIVERFGVRRTEGSVVADDGPVADDAVVSMNLWGFEPGVLDALAAEWERFLAAHRDEPDAELLLPSTVDVLVQASALAVSSLRAAGQWIGITHPEDLEAARAWFAARDA